MARRSRQTPWIHRWSRQIIAAIATCGALLTAYLLVTHFTNQQVALCTSPNEGCDVVLSSAYAQFLGIPLPIFGCLAYVGLGASAVAPLLVNPDRNKELHQKLENITWTLLLAGSVTTTLFSAYLMSLLIFVFKTPCLYCISSATFMTSILVLTLVGRYWEDIGQVVFTSAVVGIVALIGVLGFHASASQVYTTANSYQAQLALHLKAVGAKMYGAYWCPHCHDQKMLFGAAFDRVKSSVYVECDPQGENAQPQLCQTPDVRPNIKGFPTWQVKGQWASGTQTLDQLADLSGYTGTRELTPEAGTPAAPVGAPATP